MTTIGVVRHQRVNVPLTGGDLSLKHVGEFMSVDALRFYINCVDYSL